MQQLAVAGRFAFIAVLESIPAHAARVPARRRQERLAQGIVRHDRSDHSTHRDVPMSTREVCRRAAQSRLHPLSCAVRSPDRQVAANRAGRSCRGPLLVALGKSLDPWRTTRANARPPSGRCVSKFPPPVRGCQQRAGRFCTGLRKAVDWRRVTSIHAIPGHRLIPTHYRRIG